MYGRVSARKNPLSPNEFEPRTVQPVPSRYTVYVIPAILGKYNVSVSMIHGGRTFLRNVCTHKSYQNIECLFSAHLPKFIIHNGRAIRHYVSSAVGKASLNKSRNVDSCCSECEFQISCSGLQ